MGARERMSAVDTAWLRMDSDKNLMMIVGVYEFDGAINVAQLRESIESRLLTHRRFRSRVVRELGGCYWEEVDTFSLDEHLVEARLPGRGSETDLKKLVGALASERLDPTKPLWQMQLIKNFNGGHALVVRIHHCIADGIALIGVLLALTTDQADDARTSDAKSRYGSALSARVASLSAVAVKAIESTGEAARNLLRGYGAMIDTRGAVAEAALRYATIASRVASDAAAIALMSQDSSSSLKGHPSGDKVVAWNAPIPVNEVKAVAKALGCSVNDVLLSCVTGAIRSYLQGRGEGVDGGEFRAMVPVNLREPQQWKDLGNKFGLVPVLLPIGIANPIARVFEVQRRMQALKSGYTAVLSMGLLSAVGLAPGVVQSPALDFLTRKASAVMTNVPGPSHALYLAGARIKRLMFWVPQSGSIGVGVSILSYDGGVQFGLITDRNLCADPQQVIDRFEPEFEQLVLALCMLPWGSGVDAEDAPNWLFSASSGGARVPPDRSKRHPRTR